MNTTTLPYIVPTSLRIKALRDGFYPTMIGHKSNHFVFLRYDSDPNGGLAIETGYFSSINTESMPNPQICLFKEIGESISQKTFVFYDPRLLLVHEFEMLLDFAQKTDTNQLSPESVLNRIFFTDLCKYLSMTPRNLFEGLRKFEFDKEKSLNESWIE